jgi:hypothetical protein
MEDQYAKFLSKENFVLAYLRIKTKKRDAYKEFFYKDFQIFELFFYDNIDQLIFDVSEGIYKPSICEKYYMPKKRNLARPITVLSLIDQIVYQSLANIIADIFYPLMSRYFNLNTFGNIFIHSDMDNNIFFYEKWKTQWINFNKYKKKAFEDGYKFCMNFDIASFYDTIDHNILIQILRKHSIDEKLIDLLVKCLKEWATNVSMNFNKNTGIPQGPITSAFFSEVYLFMLDEEIRKQTNIKYFRYSDDIVIMTKTFEECQKMIVYLNLLALDFALIPQSEKIDITCIEDINKHINNVTSRFSKITHEYIYKNCKLKSSTHNKLKENFIKTITDKKYDKTIIRFALYKLNKDNEVKNIIIKNIKEMELFYNEIIFYFDRYFQNDEEYKQHIINYLLGDTVLYQYNKSLLFKNSKHLDFNEIIYKANFIEDKRFWIVQYYMTNWLKNCNKQLLTIENYKGENYFIEREINTIKTEIFQDETTKKIFIEKIIENPNPMLSLQGLLLWKIHFPLNEYPDISGKNGYTNRILTGKINFFINHVMNKLFSLNIPQKLIDLIKKDQKVYLEVEENIREFINNRDLKPSYSLMNLDLLHNMIFDVIAKDKGYKYEEGNFGANLTQMKDEFPLAYNTFKLIHENRNQRTEAHPKDKNGNMRKKITRIEYENLLGNAKLHETYNEIFQQYA